MALMAAGVGSSTKEPLTIFNKGWVFIIDVIWKKALYLTAANFLYGYNRPTSGPFSNFTSFTTHTIVINRYSIKNIDNLPLEYSYKFITILIDCLFLNLSLEILGSINIMPVKTKNLKGFENLGSLNFSFAAKVLI